MTKRVTVSLPDELHERLSLLAGSVESSVSAQLRRSARLLLRRGDSDTGEEFDPAEWRVTGLKETHGTIRRLVAVNTARSRLHSEGAHIVVYESEAVFVLPDGATSGQKRSRLITEALAACIDIDTVEPLPYLVGWLWIHGVGSVRLVDGGQVNYGD